MLSLFRSSRGAATSQRAWGDGLLDGSLGTLWYSADWSTIDPDELLFLSPSLSASQAANDADTGLSRHIEQRFSQEIQATALKLGGLAKTKWGGGHTLDRMRSSGALNAFLAGRAPDQNARRGDALRAPRLLPLKGEARAIWLYDLFVLACVDRMLFDAAPVGEPPLPMLLVHVGLADALVASIHTGVNAGYVYPQYAYAHETLMCGAWLGLLAAGRAAYMPTAVGEVLIAYLDRRVPWDDSSEAKLADILGYYANFAGGRERLLKVARKVSASGSPTLVRPRRQPSIGPARVEAWNAELTQRLSERL
ncbi:hypothetical protein [Hyphomicrobium sp. CS1GBMeth3]|uniref:hypothetical protein n=1 Tax=Hyphomicrobium sp. CS1GBMeth3 TaxID=1892845 RepID=UPI00093200BA|nr:hypothetical protein [Hyphomicrobium sp. CS1GBMeth3]